MLLSGFGRHGRQGIETPRFVRSGTIHLRGWNHEHIHRGHHRGFSYRTCHALLLQTHNKKTLAIFELLNSLVFSGIAPDVRKQLHFLFQDKEVEELQQVVILIANDGERSISNLIEPLTLCIPEGVEVLDAFILYRHPKTLKAEVHSRNKNGTTDLVFGFALLNSRDFFTVKLLLSGSLSREDLQFAVLADDLPRTINTRRLRYHDLAEQHYKVNWGLFAFAIISLIFPTWLVAQLYSSYQAHPVLFPYPWESYVFSLQSLWLLVPAILMIVFSGFFSLLFILAAWFGGEYPPRGDRPSFPLPEELRRTVFQHFVPRLMPEMEQTEETTQGDQTSLEGD